MCFGARKPQNEPQNLKFVARASRKAREPRSGTRKSAAGDRSWNPAATSPRMARARKTVAGGNLPSHNANARTGRQLPSPAPERHET